MDTASNDQSWIRRASPNDLLKDEPALEAALDGLEGEEEEDEGCSLHSAVKSVDKDPEGGWRVVSCVPNVAEFLLLLAEGLEELEGKQEKTEGDDKEDVEKAIGEFLESVRQCEDGSWMVTSHVEKPEELVLFLCPDSALNGLEDSDEENEDGEVWAETKGADNDSLP